MLAVASGPIEGYPDTAVSQVPSISCGLGRGLHQDATEYPFYPWGLHQPCRKIPVNNSRLDTPPLALGIWV